MAVGTRHASNVAVQEDRRRWLHALIHAGHPDGPYWSYKLVREAAAGRPGWPEATWVGAVKGPPDYQQVVNYVKQLVRDGKLEFSVYANGRRTNLFCSITEPELLESRRMRARAAEALGLQKKGLNGIEIADRLEISRSLAYSLINDPYGDKERERKKGYCPSCGGKLEKSQGWCRKCKGFDPEDLLPPSDFLAVARRVQRERGIEVVFGVTEDCERVVRLGTKRGIVEHRLKSTESWDDAVEALEL